MTHKEAAAILDEALATIGEHFDAVQILASVHDHEGSRYVARGVGNWFTRTGMAREFLDADYQQDQARLIAREIAKSEED